MKETTEQKELRIETAVAQTAAKAIYEKMCEIERAESMKGKDDRGHLMMIGFRQCMAELHDVCQVSRPLNKEEYPTEDHVAGFLDVMKEAVTVEEVIKEATKTILDYGKAGKELTADDLLTRLKTFTGKK